MAERVAVSVSPAPEIAGPRPAPETAGPSPAPETARSCPPRTDPPLLTWTAAVRTDQVSPTAVLCYSMSWVDVQTKHLKTIHN